MLFLNDIFSSDSNINMYDISTELFKTIDNTNISIKDIVDTRILSTCPHCNNNYFVKYGKYRGVQRYKCLTPSCNKTFTQITNSIFYNSKKPISYWVKYLALMNNKTSLRLSSSLLKINLATAFSWRHKILYANKNNNPIILKDYVEASKIVIKENFKGDRLAKKLEKKNVFIACAMDVNASILSKPISKYTIDLSKVIKFFSNNISKSAVISTYNDRYFSIFASKHNKNILPISSKTILEISDKIYNNRLGFNDFFVIKDLNTNLPAKNIFIHSFSLNIKKWLKKFKGVATKYLENYLNWHIIDFKNGYSCDKLDQIIFFKEYFLEFSYLKLKDFSKFKLSCE